jgi:alkanesulfonate monooxygenase
MTAAPVHFIGFVNAARWSDYPETVIDLGYVREMTAFHEQLGYDSILIGYGPGSPDPLQISAYAAAHSERIRMLIAHRAGVVFPTLAARMFATLDHITAGRISINLVPGGTIDSDVRCEGDFLAKDQRYARTGEYIEVLRAAWTSPAPFSHHGDYYEFEDYPAYVRPLQTPSIPIYVAGSSEAGRRIAGQYADHYACYGETLAGTAELMDSVRRAAADAGRDGAPEFTVRLPIVLGDTDDAAWERAAAFLARSGGETDDESLPPVNAAEARIRVAGANGQRHDRALWIVRADKWQASFCGLVGSPQTVAAALLDYVRLGVTGFRISGLDYIQDTETFGRSVIPAVRAGAEAC